MEHKKYTTLTKCAGISGIVLVLYAQAMLMTTQDTKFAWETIILGVCLLIEIFLAVAEKYTAERIVTVAITIGFLFERLIYMIVAERAMDLFFIVGIASPFLLYLFLRMFIIGTFEQTRELDILKEKQEDLIMLSPETGLYNQKSLLCDIRMQYAYCERNKLVLSLLLLKIDLVEAKPEVIDRETYIKIMREFGITITDTVRVEDKVYSVDDAGIFGVLLICNQEGSESVINRLKSVLGNHEMFDKIAGGKAKFTVKTECKQYVAKEYGEDVMFFLREMMAAIR